VRTTQATTIVAAAILAIAIGAIPAVALAKFSSSQTATATISSGPAAPTGVTATCTSKKLTVSWTAPAGDQPTSYTMWFTVNGKEPYTEAKTVPGTQTSTEIPGALLKYTSYIKASYGTWTSPYSAASNTILC
jgi:hypothetical protein